MVTWLTPRIAVVLMYLGVLPSIANVYLLWNDRYKPGVVWFILSMMTGGVWAFLFATLTLVSDPGITLALANLFWAVVPTAAVSMFLLAYEFVFKRTVSRRVVAVLFAPILVLFVLSWFDPGTLVFTAEYRVGPDGILRFPDFGGPVKVAVTKVYGYLLVFLGAGMFVGDALRAEGIHRRQTVSLLVVFSILILSTMVKVAGLVPVYLDPTSVVYSLSGVLFARSIRKHGLLKFAPLAREQTFQEVTDAILVVDSGGMIVDANDSARQLFGERVIGQRIEAVLSESTGIDEDGTLRTVEVQRSETTRFFSMRTSPVAYGRGLEGRIVVLNEVTELKKRENELDLLKQILVRVLRHNIRNDLNVVVGYAEFIEEESEGEVAKWAAEIHDTAARIVTKAEKVRTIEGVFSSGGRVRRSLGDEVERVLDSYRSDPEVTVRSDVDDVAVDVHPRFDLAIRELLDNALTHHTGADAPEIDVYTEVTGTGVSLVVEDNGPGLPPDEIEVLEAERETDLEHSSGIGLWLVHWITVRSDGTLATEVTDTGTRIRITLPRATVDSGDPDADPG